MTAPSVQHLKSKSHYLSKSDRAHYHNHILQWENSGMSQIEYCAQHSLKYNTFSYQRSYLLKNKRPQKQAEFIPVKPKVVQEISGVKSNTMILRLANGITLELPENMPAAELSSLLKIASQL